MVLVSEKAVGALLHDYMWHTVRLDESSKDRVGLPFQALFSVRGFR